MRLLMVPLGFLLVFGISACDIDVGNPTPEDTERWSRLQQERCQAFWEGGNVVDVPADLAERIVAGLRPEVPAEWGNPSLSHQPDELLPTAGAYVGRGPSPLDAWMVRIDTDKYIAKLAFMVTDIDERDYPRQAFVVVRGPLGRPETISWISFLEHGKLQQNPTLFEAETSVVEVPRGYECSRATSP